MVDAAPNEADAHEPHCEKEDKVEKFEVQHFEAFREAGLPWPAVFSEAFIEKTWCLSERQQQLLHLDEQTRGFANTLDVLEVRDLNASFERQGVRIGSCPTITSCSTIWVRGRYLANGGWFTVDRKLCGSELLRLQGLPPDVWRPCCMDPAQQVSQKDLVDLAGNAFCSGHLIPVFAGMVSCLPWAEAFRLSTMPMAMVPEADEEGAELEGEEEEEYEEESEEEETAKEPDAVASDHSDVEGDFVMD